MEHFIKTVNIKKQKQKMYFWFFFFGCVSFIVHHPNTYSLSYPFDVSSTSTHSVSGRCKNWRSDTWESELRNNQFYPSLLPPERTINFSTPSLHHWKSGENREGENSRNRDFSINKKWDTTNILLMSDTLLK